MKTCPAAVGQVPERMWNDMRKATQAERVLDYITEFGSITQMEALKDLGVMRLASRISDLKKMGYPITSSIEVVKNRYGEKCHVKRYSIKMGGED